MRKQLLLAAAAGMVLISAHPPAGDHGPAPREARSGYPPCSRTVTDSCIQLYERGVRAETRVAHKASAEPAPAGDDDIDVAYAGEVLQAPRSDHRPAVVAQAPGANRAAPGPAHRAMPATAPATVLASGAPRAYPACTAGLTDRCSQYRRHKPNQRMAMRVRRAGERG